MLREGKVAAKPILSYQLEHLDSDFGHLRTRNYPHLSIFPVFLKLVKINFFSISFSRVFLRDIFPSNIGLFSGA